MLILGIDPGSLYIGHGLIEYSEKKYRYIDSGVARFDHISNLVDRLVPISDAMEKIAKLYRPDAISIESLIYVKNVDSMSKLSQARGAALASLMKNCHAKVFEYSPNLVKQTVCGHGHATKLGVDKFVSLILGKKDFLRHDESDALAMAICHSVLYRTKTTSNIAIGRSIK